MTRQPIRARVPLQATGALRRFLATEAAGGLLLLVATVIALAWANSPWHGSYEQLWETEMGVRVGGHDITMDLRHWVNEGLMAVFFLVVGLEVKRELLLGELRDGRRAVLPVAGALGGMLVPAFIFVAFNLSTDAVRGWGVPMATDIAFAVGVLAVVGRGLPSAVRLFLLTLAIVDDIGAIVVIAVFYSSDIEWRAVTVAVGVVVGIVGLRRLGVRANPVIALLGAALWLALHEAGVHATLAGVAMGLLAPATATLSREIIEGRLEELADVSTPRAARSQTRRLARHAVSELEWIEHLLHGWSSFLIVPIFALANAGIVLSATSVADAVTSPVTLGVVAGLVVGKTFGITAAAWLATRIGIAELPGGVTWRQITGVAALGGIGFTVSLFIAALAFDSADAVGDAKIGILAASVLASLVGAAVLRGQATVAEPDLDPSVR